MIEFYFEQQQNSVAVKLRSDAGINAWSGKIVAEGKLSGLRIINSGGTDIFWQQLPTVNGNEIVFAGGVPGGFSGDKPLFQITAVGEGNFSFTPDTAAYLNNGFGTQTTSTLTTFHYINATSSQLVSDNTPPLPFEVTLYRNSSLFGGKPVVMFQAQDPDSGINHYDVSEITRNSQTGWHRAESPYIINDDVTKIEVRAVDNFGNERVESLTISPTLPVIYLAVGLVFIVAVAVVYTIYTWRKRKHPPAH